MIFGDGWAWVVLLNCCYYSPQPYHEDEEEEARWLLLGARLDDELGAEECP